MTRNIKITTTTANEEILTNPLVYALIIERMGWANRTDVANLWANALGKGFEMKFTIFFDADNTLSINGGLPLNILEEVVYDSGCYLPFTKSIIITNPASITFSFDIR